MVGWPRYAGQSMSLGERDLREDKARLRNDLNLSSEYANAQSEYISSLEKALIEAGLKLPEKPKGWL